MLFIKKFLKKIGVLKIRNFFRKQSALHYLRKNKNYIKGDGIIDVAFIVYEPAMWDKQEPVYLKMLNHQNFKPTLIVTPDYNVSESEQLKKLKFFCDKYPSAVKFDNSVLSDFKRNKYKYTFYQTPYNFKYPLCLQPHKLVKYSKLCFVPYAYIGSEVFFEVSSQESFFQNIYFGFMDSEPMSNLLLQKFKKSCESGIQNFMFLGYPPFEQYVNAMNEDKTIKNILWIPRWSYAEKGGGSHFLEYKNAYNKLALELKDFNWAMRPHPLMFPNLTNQGLMSLEEQEDYRNISQSSGVSIDEHSLLNDTLFSTDLLIADYSSIIIMYFLTGRPIIYCDSGIELSGFYKTIFDCMYIAKNWSDVENHLKNITNGNDPLKEKRQKLCSIIVKQHKNASENILKKILNDYFS